MNDPDAELVARAGAGDRAAASLLIARHLPKMLALARRMLGEGAEAEDVAQDTFLKLWTQAARWRPGQARFETWLYRITLNGCYDRLRKRKTARLEDVPPPLDPTPGPDRLAASGQAGAALASALQALPERQRAAILLCHVDGCGNIEAAEILGVSVEALESLLTRGRRTLRERLKAYRDQDGT